MDDVFVLALFIYLLCVIGFFITFVMRKVCELDKKIVNIHNSLMQKHGD